MLQGVKAVIGIPYCEISMFKQRAAPAAASGLIPWFPSHLCHCASEKPSHLSSAFQRGMDPIACNIQNRITPCNLNYWLLPREHSCPEVPLNFAWVTFVLRSSREDISGLLM